MQNEMTSTSSDLHSATVNMSAITEERDVLIQNNERLSADLGRTGADLAAANERLAELALATNEASSQIERL